MGFVSAVALILLSALVIIGYLVWIFGWRWEALQFAIVLAFAVVGLFIGSAVYPGSRFAEAAMMIPFAVLGFVISGWTTRLVSNAIDKSKASRAGRSRSPD